MEKCILTTKEVADYFKVTPNCVTQNFIKRGLKYIKVGTKCYRYNIKDVLEFETEIKEQYVLDKKYEEFIQFKVSKLNNKKDGIRYIE